MDTYIAYFDETGDDGITTKSSSEFVLSSIYMPSEKWQENYDAANTEDKIELYDGRNRAQNGWYVMSTVISATKAGETAIEWIVEPNVKEGWVRTPNVGFSQVGYSPAQEKFAVVELDKYDNDYPKTMSLWRVNADGSELTVA